jgi:hypothetical protein
VSGQDSRAISILSISAMASHACPASSRARSMSARAISR